MPLRVAGSTDGATARTRPSMRLRWRVVRLAAHAGPQALRVPPPVTSARHSRRPPRIRRNSSWLGCVSEPTVAVRAEITPSSGATMRVCASRTSSAWTRARAAARRAAVVCSAVRTWIVACGLMKPCDCNCFERSALALASASAASASTTDAVACARSAETASAAMRASGWPRLTVSPTLTSTSVSRKPESSAPMMASCHAVMLPLAEIVRGQSAFCGATVLTVSAGRVDAASFFAAVSDGRP